MVESGDANGFALFALLKPADGVHWYVSAPLAEICTESFKQTEIRVWETFTVGGASLMMVTLSVAIQPPFSVTVTWYVPATSPVAEPPP